MVVLLLVTVSDGSCATAAAWLMSQSVPGLSRRSSAVVCDCSMATTRAAESVMIQRFECRDQLSVNEPRLEVFR